MFSDIPLQTSIGELLLTVTDGDHIYVDCNGNSRVAQVSGKPIRFTLHMSKFDNVWTYNDASGRSSLYCKKADATRWNLDEATDTQKRKVLEAVLPELYKWIGDNQRLLFQKQYQCTLDKISSYKEQIEEKECEIADLRKKMQALSCTLVNKGN